MKYLSITLRLVAAGILAQTLFFKFSGAPESVYIFSRLGVEPWGRWIAGISELIACGLLLYPKTRIFGAIAAIVIMAGAILSHLFVLGVVVQDDGGELFALALVVTFCCSVLMYVDRGELKRVIIASLKITGMKVNGLS